MDSEKKKGLKIDDSEDIRYLVDRMLKAIEFDF